MENCSHVTAVVTIFLVLSTHVQTRMLTTNRLQRDENDKTNMDNHIRGYDELKANETDRVRRRVQIIPPFVQPDHPVIGAFQRRRYRAVSQETGEWDQSGDSRKIQLIRQRRSLRSPILWNYLEFRKTHGYGSESGRWGRSTADDVGLLKHSKDIHDKSTQHHMKETDRSMENTSKKEHSYHYKFREKRNAKYWSNQKLLRYITWRAVNGYGSEKNRYGWCHWCEEILRKIIWYF